MAGRDDPFAEIEDLFDQFTDFGAGLSSEIPVDVVDTDDAVFVIADLPGQDPEDVQVRLEDERHLDIEAPAREEERDGRYVLRGRPKGETSSSVHLPAAVDESDTGASYDRGVLTVRLGKPGGEEGTDIPVN